MWATTWARRAAGGDVCRGASTVCTVGRPGAGVPCRARVESEANLTHVLRRIGLYDGLLLLGQELLDLCADMNGAPRMRTPSRRSASGLYYPLVWRAVRRAE